MSFLADFGGAFFTGVGNEIQQRENEDRQLRLQMALEDRRRRIARQDRFRDLVTENNLNAKPYVGYDSQGRMGLLQDEFAMGDTGPTRTARRLGDAPRVPTGEVERKEGSEWVRYRQFSDNTEEVISRAPRNMRSGGIGGMTTDQQIDNKRADEQLGLAREAAERGRRQDERQARKDAVEEANSRIRPFLDQVDELAAATASVDDVKSGTSALARFMAAQGAPREAQTNPAAAKAWLQKRAQSEVFAEYGIGQSGGSAPDGKADAPQVPSGAKDGQVYEDDDGKLWRVSGGKMVPA